MFNLSRKQICIVKDGKTIKQAPNLNAHRRNIDALLKELGYEIVIKKASDTYQNAYDVLFAEFGYEHFTIKQAVNLLKVSGDTVYYKFSMMRKKGMLGVKISSDHKIRRFYYLKRVNKNKKEMN